MWTQPLLFLLSLGIGISQARPAADSTTTLAIKPTSTTKPQSCFDKGCTVEQVPVWDDVLGKCVCKWSLGPFPEVCEDMLCIAEMEVKYDPDTGKCGCYWIPGLGPAASKVAVREVAAAAATLIFPPCTIYCPTGYHLEQSNITGICSCVKDPACPGIVCISEMHPVYNYTSGKCACEWIDGFGSPTVLTPPPASITPAPSSLAVREPAPTTLIVCSLLCVPGYHITTDSTTGLCRCEIDDSCVGIFCISEKHPVYDSTLGKCTCVWYPEFAPVSTIYSSSAVASTTKPASTPTTAACLAKCPVDYHLENDPITGKCKCVPPTLCPDTICIAEMYAVYDASTQKCGCQWIAGLEPSLVSLAARAAETSPVVIYPSCPKNIYCIAEMHFVYDPELMRCTCKWIPGLEPSSLVLPARAVETSPPIVPPCATIRCAAGYHTFINEKGVCSCVKDAEPLPCGIRCKSGYHLETSLDTGKCSCVLDPVVISEEELCLKYTACLLGHPVWNSDTQTCGCSTEDTPALQGRQSISCCAATLCLTGTHPVCHGSKCVCEPTPDSEQLCLIATTCLTGSRPVWNATTKKCSCVGNVTPQQSCLIATTCLVGSEPVWNAGTQTCTCQANGQTICETATECSPGSTPVWNSDLQICRCVGVS